MNIIGGYTYFVYGFDIGDVVNNGGQDDVLSGSTANGTVVNSGGQDYVDGVTTGTVVNNGGQEFVYGDGVTDGTILNAGGQQYVDGIANSTAVNSGGQEYVNGSTICTVVNSGGQEYVYGIANSTVVNSGGQEYVYGNSLGSVVMSGGTLFANGGLVDIAATANKGGTILIGNSTVYIQQASTDDITFQLGGTGGLTLFNPKGYTGKVTGFGGNSNQFIDFTHIHSAGAIVHYTSKSNNSGVLTVTSGGHTVASINLVGHYTTADFHPGNDGSGHLEITDPPVVEQKPGNVPATIAADSVLEVKVIDSGEVTFAGPTGTLWLDRPSIFTGKVADFGLQESIDLPGIPFGVHTTLGYSENSNDTGGILTVKDGIHSAKIALLGNYMATSFVTAADGHSGTLITEAAQTANQSVPLTTPHTG